MPWFSASARYASTVECDGLSTISRSVWVFELPDTGERLWADARARALEIARRDEHGYLNADGRRVQWELIDVQTLDLLGDTVEDGREVYSEMRDPSEAELREWPARTRFDPENTPPHQTGI
ncbi:DUF4288 domain-containing protein [Allokutzneria albata]|uniref:DUF4288 domain-containing protein n=1 Tax=Allokutzneria albata TaxID=211114 RepID=A0A1G9SWE2_ALLAB|nr:DUF4288 domain-containing protein [Allokutzneria albata]SDM39732.1 protein of unknown function [Allokutzneria albata]